MATRATAVAGLMIFALSTSCVSEGAPTGSVGEVAIAVAPLELAGVGNARYTLTVLNGDDATVWTRTVESDQYGDGAGSVAYVGTCDADAPDSTVQLVVEALYDEGGAEIDAWSNPTADGPLERDFTCVANQDVAVDFDLVIARAATQGFFDVAVELNDVFCAAKLDCGATTAIADDLLLLHDGQGGRGTTAVLGFACTAGPQGAGDTYLYLDDLEITCAGRSGETTVVAVTEAGTIADLDAAPGRNPDGYLFAAAVYQGTEELANKRYWNVALGLDRETFSTLGLCTLTTNATATDTPLTLGTTPDASAYPYVAWDVPLSDGSGRLCTEHAVDDGGEVETRYATAGAPETFDAVYSSATGLARVCGSTVVLPDGIDQDCDGLADPPVAVDDFEGSSLGPHWTLVQGTLPTYTVSGSALHVTNADPVESLVPGMAGHSWINELDVDRGNQIAWPQPVGTGDLELLVDIGWTSASAEITMGLVALTDADDFLHIAVGDIDGTSGGYGKAEATGLQTWANRWTGTVLASGSGSFRVVRVDGWVSIWYQGALVYGPSYNDADIAKLAFVYMRGGWMDGLPQYGTVDLGRVELTY